MKYNRGKALIAFAVVILIYGFFLAVETIVNDIQKEYTEFSKKTQEAEVSVLIKKAIEHAAKEEKVISAKKVETSIDLFSDNRMSLDKMNVVFAAAKNEKVDPYFIMSVILVQSNGDNDCERGLLGAGKFVPKDLTLYSFDVAFAGELHNYLIKSGYYIDNSDIPSENFKQRKTLIKSYTDLFGNYGLNRLYNYYYLLSGEKLK